MQIILIGLTTIVIILGFTVAWSALGDRIMRQFRYARLCKELTTSLPNIPWKNDKGTMSGEFATPDGTCTLTLTPCHTPTTDVDLVASLFVAIPHNGITPEAIPPLQGWSPPKNCEGLLVTSAPIRQRELLPRMEEIMAALQMLRTLHKA